MGKNEDSLDEIQSRRGVSKVTLRDVLHKFNLGPGLANDIRFGFVAGLSVGATARYTGIEGISELILPLSGLMHPNILSNRLKDVVKWSAYGVGVATAYIDNIYGFVYNLIDRF